jgi:ATP-dependent DNA helicase 2 subunit 2
MPADRAGYQVSVYAIDVSASMGEVMEDPAGSSSSQSQKGSKTKLDFAKEYVARKCEPKVGIILHGNMGLGF